MIRKCVRHLDNSFLIFSLGAQSILKFSKITVCETVFLFKHVIKGRGVTNIVRNGGSISLMFIQARKMFKLPSKAHHAIPAQPPPHTTSPRT